MAAGAVLGWTSPILSEVEHGAIHNITVSDSQMGWIGSFATLGAMFMCFPTGLICDLIGRKTTLLLLVFPFSIGWSLIIWARSVLMLYFGRFILGTAVGACCVAAPLYTSEVAQKEIRGTLGSYFQLMVTIGILYVYIVGDALTINYYTVACAACTLVFVVCFFFQPETPLYYIKKGKFEKAKASLLKLRGPGYDVTRELGLIESEVKENNQSTFSLCQILKQKATLRALLITFGLMFFQQFSGINAIILYSSDIFIESGVKFDPKIACVVVAAFQAMATFASSLVVDKWGRRLLLLISASVMALSSLILGIFFTLKTHNVINGHTLNDIAFLPTLSLCTFVIVFSLGFGPIPWMISSEVFIPQVKSIAGAAAGSFNWGLAFLITKFYIELKNEIGQDTMFYIFAANSCIATLFVYFIVRETKGKTIEEIQNELSE